MSGLIERLEAYDPKLSPDNRADETDLHDSIVMATGSGSLTHAFEATFVRSIDAAMALVPEGWRPLIDCTPDDKPIVELFANEDTIRPIERGCGATPALALCIAALKAREQSK